MRPNQYAIYTAGVALLVAVYSIVSSWSGSQEQASQPLAATALAPADQQWPGADRQSFPVKNLSVTDAARSLNAVAGMHIHHVDLDEKRNVLSVVAPNEVMDDVARLLSVIDQSSTDTSQDTKVIALKNADPRTIETAMVKIFGVRTASTASTSVR